MVELLLTYGPYAARQSVFSLTNKSQLHPSDEKSQSGWLKSAPVPPSEERFHVPPLGLTSREKPYQSAGRLLNIGLVRRALISIWEEAVKLMEQC